MFAPTAANNGGPATATRSRRRRERPKSSESLVQQPKAKRQRLPLTEQTFTNPDANVDMVEAKQDKTPNLPTPRSSEGIENLHSTPTPRRESNIRSKKQKHGDRAVNKGDGSLVLASTNAYVVSKLPALPDRLRADTSGAQQADISSFGYAVTLTPTHALVWPYAATAASPETFTFTLPPPSSPNDPLPVASLVSPSASSREPGLVVVTAGSAKVVYWESISSAATFDFMKRERTGVEHGIAGLSSGERVIRLTNAESAGFILSFNTGRLAYLNVRDGHGRPCISVQYLRSNSGPSTGGFFGSIRHAFSNLSLRGDLAAVHADKSVRIGEKNIVALSSKAKLQAWKIHRGGHHECLGDADMREQLAAAIHEADPSSRDFPADSLEALDFTYVPKGMEEKYTHLSSLSEAMVSDDASLQHLLLLVSLSTKTTSRYALVEVILYPSVCQIGMIRPISSYSSPASGTYPHAQTSRPRLYLPRPALVAFAVFDRAVVVASVAATPDSPELQLQSDNHILPSTFEDVVDFREDILHEVIGSGIEEMPSTTQAFDESRNLRHKTKNPAVVLLVRGAGVVRIVTTDIDRFASDQAPQVSAKSKLEQAVFFGARLDNPLLFSRRQGVQFTNDEIAAAAVEVSHDILSSASPYISNLPASIVDSLKERSEALRRLIDHVRSMGVQMNRKRRWILINNAEKMHVAHLLWKRHEKFISERPADDKKSLVGLIVEFIHQDQKHNPVAEIGEVDRVRHWFINDIYRMELFVAWAYEVIKVLYKDRLLDEAKVTVMIHEAIQVNVCAHNAAIKFRRENLGLYGLEHEHLALGILQSGYEELDEIWTGNHYVANNMRRLTELADHWYSRNARPADDSAPLARPDPAVVGRIAEDLPALVDCMLVSILEQARYAKAAHQTTVAQTFMKAYQDDQYEKPLSLTRMGKGAEGARIAERHGCLEALALILVQELELLEEEKKGPRGSKSEKDALDATVNSKLDGLEHRFRQYGQAFAFPAFEYMLASPILGIGAVLGWQKDPLGSKTHFLRSKPELARIAWIHEVEGEKDIDCAAETLIEVAISKEQQVWNKKVELSLGKIALLADLEESEANAGQLQVNTNMSRHDAALANVDNELVVITIQEMLYDQIVPSTHDAVDHAAALSFAMEAHGQNVPKKQKALLQVLEEGMGRLLKHETLDAMTLIDLLTLVALNSEVQNELAHPFWLALKVAANSCHSDELKEAKRLIWRRAYIRDEWNKINDTQLKGDQEVVLAFADTELFAAFTDCIRYQDPRHPFQPMPPMQALGAFTQTLDRRFRDFDSGFQSKLAEAMRAEDKLLQQNLAKYRLADWVTTVFDAAEKDVALDLDEATRSRAPDESPVVGLLGTTMNGEPRGSVVVAGSS